MGKFNKYAQVVEVKIEGRVALIYSYGEFEIVTVKVLFFMQLILHQ